MARKSAKPAAAKRSETSAVPGHIRIALGQLDVQAVTYDITPDGLLIDISVKGPPVAPYPVLPDDDDIPW